MKQQLLIASIFLISSLVGMEDDNTKDTESVLSKTSYTALQIAPKGSLPDEYLQLSGTWRNMLADQLVVSKDNITVPLEEANKPAFELLKTYLPLALLIHQEKQQDTKNTLTGILKEKVCKLERSEYSLLGHIATPAPEIPGASAWINFENQCNSLSYIKLGVLANLSHQLDIPIIREVCLEGILYNMNNNWSSDGLGSVSKAFLSSKCPEQFNPFHLNKDVLSLLARMMVDKHLQDLLPSTSRRINQVHRPHEWSISNVLYNPNSKTIITAGQDKKIKLWDAWLLPQDTIDAGIIIRTLGLSPRHDTLVVSGYNEQGESALQIWRYNASSDQKLTLEKTIKKGTSYVQWTADGTAFFIDKDTFYRRSDAEWTEHQINEERPWQPAMSDTPTTWLEQAFRAYKRDCAHVVFTDPGHAVAAPKRDIGDGFSKYEISYSLEAYSVPAALQTVYETITFQQALLLRDGKPGVLETYPNLRALYTSLEEGPLKNSGLLGWLRARIS